MNQSAVLVREVSSLTIHPILDQLPMIPEGDPRWRELCATWDQVGFPAPLVVTRSGQIVDGRHRLRFALARGWQTVPVVEVEDSQIFDTVVASLLGRVHLTKGQRAYLSFPLLQASVEEAKTQPRDASGRLAPSSRSVEDISEAMGFSWDVLDRSRKLHGLFQDADKAGNPSLRAKWEPKILREDDPVGLGAAIAGIAGEAAKDKVIGFPRNSTLHKLQSGLTALAAVSDRWDSMSEGDREAALSLWCETIERLSPGMAKEWFNPYRNKVRKLQGSTSKVSPKARQAMKPSFKVRIRSKGAA